jgi:shikimate 5-dehydrogenase
LARKPGGRTLDGGGMVVFQAAKAITLFSPTPSACCAHSTR